MVKVAIAAASSQLAKEVIDKLVEAKKHEIIGLVRKDPAQYPPIAGVKYVQTKYDKKELVDILKGVETVLCFLPVHSDPGSVIQKRLIDASIESGVKRIAPSEWATGVKLEDSLDVIPWYAGKVDVARYLEEVNKEKKVIEYTRFQVGSFMNYLSHPQGGTKHVSTLPFLFLFEKQQASAIEGALDDAVSWITVQDIAGVVARAVEYEGEWPAIGGMVGTRVTVAEMLKLGESIGRPFTVKWLKLEDLEAKAKGVPPAMNESFDIHNSAPEDVEAFLEYATESLLQGIHRGAYDVTDEWNKLLPDYKFTQVGDYIKKYWGPK
ncbi:NAD(P)-binding protein [Annulohypoxylon maeteangense]|uniref:NAD(P)-binding protein n=1 Tax=Annulohypoxylon maeteangense TaxID=1927788 RepID=UPI002008D286|nr:NAD(P)-binding protein [Annulohypoxylon maeteangense]KAI0890461.1 NAD(P)-binding protein [Annulohypoxylon maeteangense]